MARWDDSNVPLVPWWASSGTNTRDEVVRRRRQACAAMSGRVVCDGESCGCPLDLGGSGDRRREGRPAA